MSSHIVNDEPARYQVNRRSALAVMRRVRAVGRERGWGYVVRFLLTYGLQRASRPFAYAWRRLRPTGEFEFAGERYPYFCHRYTATWENERAVEVPIIWRMVRRAEGRRVLEVGNVLSHFFEVRHDIVDKFEQAPGVMNCDVVDYQPAEPYDLIVSISTLEHVGWDEHPRDPQKALRALAHLQAMLRPGGLLVCTIPMGYNHDLDALLQAGSVPFTRRACLQRVSADNRWQEVGWEAIASASYGRPFPAANGLLIGMLERPGVLEGTRHE
jgi:SAM-dependent methyltransferase